MRKTLTILAFVATIAASVAMADDDCFAPMANWQPREAVAPFAARQGWTVRRIRIDDGCYAIDDRDAAGSEIKAKVHPGMLEIVEFKVEDDEHPRGRRHDD